MRLKLLLALSVLSALACGRGDVIDDSGPLIGEAQIEINSSSFICEGSDWEFDVLTSGPVVSVEAHVWQGEDDLGVQALVERGDGDWFADRTADEVGGDCMDGDNYVEFTATSEDGQIDQASQG